ncbi:2-(3-amino-3-carboxypropyl)histidine synthase subunit 2 [Bienertia sinuspersici]
MVDFVLTKSAIFVLFFRGSQWTGAYTTEFRDLINLPSVGVEDVTDEPRFSLIQGGYVEEIDHEETTDDKEGRALALATEKALRLRDKDANGLTNFAPKSGAEFLATRSYQGLDIHHDGSTPKPVLIGRIGRAAGYDHEKSENN